MKPVVIALLLLIAAPVFAQDTTKIEQYCGLILRPRAFSNKVNIELDFGETRRAFTDNRLRDEITGKLKTFNTLVDAMNYMGQQGWVLINAFPSEHNGTSIYFEFFFKKQFNKKDIQEDK
ncbi:MAG: hypothetical protein EKK37_00025 [Sphingobacteriales bacterium]|nr:MAG: hypothetical protein EKK37_00025 [Sphingobacteriales bacterium]